MLLKRLNNIVFAAAPSVINLPNPLGTTNILDLGARLIKAGLGIAGSLALLFFIYGGFLWLTSGGSPDKIKKGKDVFLWSVVGLVIIFSSYLMVDFVIKAMTKGAADNKSQCVNNALEEQTIDAEIASYQIIFFKATHLQFLLNVKFNLIRNRNHLLDSFANANVTPRHSAAVLSL